MCRVLPGFPHQMALPLIAQPGVEMRLIVGSAFGKHAPTPAFSEIFYAKARWREQKFAQVPGETEFIPLPEK